MELTQKQKDWLLLAEFAALLVLTFIFLVYPIVRAQNDYNAAQLAEAMKNCGHVGQIMCRGTIPP